MTLSRLTREDAAKQLSSLYGSAPESIEALSELIRAEVHARQHCPRAAALARVARLLTCVVTVEVERLDEVCSELEREGDVVVAPGGVLYATPTRAVALEGSVRIFSSVPTRALAAALGREIVAKGAARTVTSVEGLTDVVLTLGGAIVTPEAWAGLDRAPLADGAFLVRLDQRLEWQALGAGALEKDCALEWRTWEPTAAGSRWRQRNEGRLWWARTRFGGHYRAWTAGGTPSSSPFVELSPDDADRARFALSREVAGASAVRVNRSGRRATLELPAWLPRPEYRWLSLHAAPTPDMKGLRWEVSIDDEAMIAKLLVERLGIEWQGDSGGNKAPPSLEDLSTSLPSLAIAPSGPGVPLCGIALDELIPERPAIMPILKTLGVRTYRDVLGLDLEAVRKIRGVGVGKIAAIKELLDYAQRRATEERQLSCAEVRAPFSPAPSLYDGWGPLSALGRLSRRLANVIAKNKIETMLALKEWHRRADPQRIDNYGSKTHRELGELILRLETEGHEALVFRGPAPVSITSLGERFLEQLDPSSREILSLRFVQGWTLEQVGQQRGVTRERIRQIVALAIAEVRTSWGARARELLEQAAAALESRGGVEPTENTLESLGSPHLWALELACELAVFSLVVDIIAGITTTLLREEFVVLRRDLREALDEAPEPLTVSVVQEVLADGGLSIPENELPVVSDAMFGITIDGDAAFANRRSVQYLYLKVLRDAGGPVSAEDVALKVNELDPSMGANKRNAVAHFKRAQRVFSVSHNKWIHEDHLPVSRDALDALAQRCLPEVKRAGGRAVSVRSLLDKFARVGGVPAAVTPNMLRDALIFTGKVRGWRAGTDVAWLDGVIAKTTIAEWVREVAGELEQPFDMGELIDGVAQRAGYLANSVAVQAYKMSDALVPVGAGQYVSKQRVWSDETSFRTALRRVEEVIVPRGLWSAEDPALRVRGLDKEIARFGAGIVWGLASRTPTVLTTTHSGMFMWPSARGATLWDVLEEGFLASCALFRPSSLRNYLFK